MAAMCPALLWIFAIVLNDGSKNLNQTVVFQGGGMKTLIIVSHPDFAHSVANQRIVFRVKEALPEVELRHLDTLSPDYKIDVAAEQEVLLGADLLIFQHPLYWFSVPASLKLWMDKVLHRGFAYGEGGSRLKGKQFIHSVTMGGPQESYSPEGRNHYTLPELLRPFELMRNLTGMHHAGTVCSYGNTFVADSGHSRAEIQATADDHAAHLVSCIRKVAKGS
jgi:putative NADPH-quinone reductase